MYAQPAGYIQVFTTTQFKDMHLCPAFTMIKSSYRKRPNKSYIGSFTLFIILFIHYTSIYGQVGINTTNPNATLDIRSSDQVAPANNEGILIPKIDNFPTVNPTINQEGMLVFVTGNSTPNRGFYYWDNTTTDWVLIAGATSTGGNTLDQSYDQGGAGLGKNIEATDGALRVNGVDGFLVTGTFGTGNIIDAEITGTGTRMFFNPNKAAFRAGRTSGDRWDDTNIGTYSTAFGVNTRASGTASAAFGLNSISSGSYSAAFGFQPTASGDYAMAFGNITNATGFASLAFGEFTMASGDASTAFGLSTLASGFEATAFGFDTVASGDESTAFGFTTIASGFASTAFGLSTNASGQRATAFGYQTTASGLSAIAFGHQTTASGTQFPTAFGFQTTASGFQTSTAFGFRTTASADKSTSFGNQTEASGDSSTAFGSDTLASGVASTAFGINSTASGIRATAFGLATVANQVGALAYGQGTEASGGLATAFGFNTLASAGQATAFGQNTMATAINATAFGRGTIAPSYSETAIGSYNTIYTPISPTIFNAPDRLFTVGNGSNSTTRSNALTIYKNGLLNINDAYNMPLTDGTPNQVMATNGAGVVSFQDASTLNGNTLDSAYDEGGFGAGRIINATNGPVEIHNTGGLIVQSTNQTHMLFVDGPNDEIGINTNNPTATLSVNGIANKLGGGTWAVFSDRRLKENITSYDEGLKLITKVRPVNFSYNHKMKSLIGKNKVAEDQIYQGIIAQELMKIAPDMVREVSLKSETFLEVDPNKFTYALINAVQEQQEIIDKQLVEIKTLELLFQKQQIQINEIKNLLRH